MTASARAASWLATLVALIGGCSHQAPIATRVRADTNDAFLPQGEIHFVEHGRRTRGVLLSASAGFDNPFVADWRAVLVSIVRNDAEAVVWTGKPLRGNEAIEATKLPIYRNAFDTGLFANLARQRFGTTAAWVLSTDPLIVALPAGEERLLWRAFATSATGIRDDRHILPVPSLVARYVVAQELSQPIDRLVCFPDDFWQIASNGDLRDLHVILINLPAPRTIDDMLDLLTQHWVRAGGDVRSVALYEYLDDEQLRARMLLEDRKRLVAR